MSHISGAIQVDPESEQSLEDLGIAGDSTGERYFADQECKQANIYSYPSHAHTHTPIHSCSGQVLLL